MFHKAEFDQPIVPADISDRKTYLIIGGPRSGSTLTCSMLYHTAKYGVPAEYFHPRVNSARRLGCLVNRNASKPSQRYDTALYLQKVLEARTTAENNAWGSKLFPKHFTWLNSTPQGTKIIETSKYIRIRRLDKISQAISLYIAYTTLKWSKTSDKEPGMVKYNFPSILRAYRTIVAHEAFWDLAEDRFGIEPLNITYEGLVKDPPSVGNEMMTFLTDGASPRLDFSADPEVVKVQVQRTHKNNNFKERFLEDFDFNTTKGYMGLMR